MFTLTNSFNQVDRVTRSGTFTAAGLVQSATNVTVTVNGSGATVYADKSFARSGITLTNGNNTFTAVATDTNTRTATNIVTAWLPATASFVYDKNGNLTSDGRRGFGYDDFDQLTNGWRSEFKYDALGRRRVRTEEVWKNSQWVTASETRWLAIASLSQANCSALKASVTVLRPTRRDHWWRGPPCPGRRRSKTLPSAIQFTWLNRSRSRR